MTYILIFTVWTLLSNGTYKAEEFREEYTTAQECKKVGDQKLKEAGKANPANYFCFKKGVKLD